MYICICNAVTDSDIHDAVDLGIHTVDQLKLHTGCSTGCGMCAEDAQQELTATLIDKKRHLRIIPAATAA